MKTLIATLFALSLGACSEKVQNLGASKNVDQPLYAGAKNAYVEKNWTPGDKASWEAQLKARNQNQNEYSRVE
jgi:hypothetical protein